MTKAVMVCRKNCTAGRTGCDRRWPHYQLLTHKLTMLQSSLRKEAGSSTILSPRQTDAQNSDSLKNKDKDYWILKLIGSTRMIQNYPDGLPPILVTPMLALLLTKNSQIFLSLVSNSATSSLSLKGFSPNPSTLAGLLLVLQGFEEDVLALTKPPFCRAASDYFSEEIGQRINVIFEIQKMGPKEADLFVRRELPYTYVPFHEQDSMVMELLIKGILPDRIVENGSFPAFQNVLKRGQVSWLVVPFIINGLLVALREDHEPEARLWHSALVFYDEFVSTSALEEAHRLRYSMRALLVTEGYIRIDKMNRDQASPLPQIPSLRWMIEVTRGLPTLLHTPRKSASSSSLSSVMNGPERGGAGSSGGSFEPRHNNNTKDN